MKSFSDTVLAIYDAEDKSKAAVEALQAAGVPAEEISLITHSEEAREELHHDISRTEEAEKKAGAGASWGGLLGLFTGIVLTPVGGVGPMILAGPIVLALGGGAVGGLVGAVTGWGVAETKYRLYEERIKAGGILIAVHGGPLDITKAYGVLKDTGAVVLELHKTSDDAP